MSERIYEDGQEFENGDVYVCDYETLTSGLVAPVLQTNVRSTLQLGGRSETFGLDLTTDITNSSGFGLRLRYRGEDLSGSVSVCGVRMRVWYLPASGVGGAETVEGSQHPAWTSAKILRSGRIVIAGTYGRIRYSDDNGQTWNDGVGVGQSIGTRTINSIERIPNLGAGNQGLVVAGNSGLILMSEDGGETWKATTALRQYEHSFVAASFLNHGLTATEVEFLYELVLAAPTKETLHYRDFHFSTFVGGSGRRNFMPAKASIEVPT